MIHHYSIHFIHAEAVCCRRWKLKKTIGSEDVTSSSSKVTIFNLWKWKKQRSPSCLGRHKLNIDEKIFRSTLTLPIIKCKEQVKELERELIDFQENSENLEKELEKSLELADTANRDLRTKCNRLTLDLDMCRVGIFFFFFRGEQ